jgi:hypothetical protein
MRHSSRAWRDLFLLLSLLLVIVLYPMLDRGEVRRLILGGLMFVPLLLATVRMAQIKVWVWPTVLLMTAVMISTAVSTLFPSRMFIGLKWGVLAAFFGLSVIVLFSYPKKCSHHRRWSSLYGGQHLPVAWNAVVCTLQRHRRPESPVDPAQRFRGSRSPRGTVVLQFGNSLTIGYGDVVHCMVKPACWQRSKGSPAYFTLRLQWRC